MAQWRNTFYTEHAPESPNEKWASANSSMVRHFDIMDGSFKGRVQAAYDFLGYQVVLSTSFLLPPYYIHRVIPMTYAGLPAANFQTPPGDNLPFVPPDISNRFYIGAISRTEPLGAMKGVNVGATPAGTAAADYARARFTCELSTFPFAIKPDSAVIAGIGPLAGFPDEGNALRSFGWQNTRYITRQIKEFNRLIKVPFGVVKIGGVFTKVPLPFREGGANVTYTWMRVPLEGPIPGANFGRIGGAQGTLNSTTFDGFDVQTLLFDTYSSREYQGPFGERLADITFNFIYMPHPSTGNNFNGGQGPAAGQKLGWNYFYDSVGGKLDYYLATQTNGITPLYRNTDFGDLFRP